MRENIERYNRMRAQGYERSESPVNAAAAERERKRWHQLGYSVKIFKNRNSYSLYVKKMRGGC